MNNMAIQRCRVDSGRLSSRVGFKLRVGARAAGPVAIILLHDNTPMQPVLEPRLAGLRMARRAHATATSGLARPQADGKTGRPAGRLGETYVPLSDSDAARAFECAAAQPLPVARALVDKRGPWGCCSGKQLP